MKAKKTYAVFGLGRYGIAVAKELVENGMEIIAVDSDQRIVNDAAAYLPVCKCADVTDAEVISRLGIGNIDTVIVCMAGNLEASVMAVTLCKEAGVKNVIAIASGIIEGAQLGDGARASLICRGFNEMTRLSKVLGGDEATMMGMCGLGDLVLTANCMQSRNFSFGYKIGTSKEASKIIEENNTTVEGLHTTKAVVKLARSLNIEMPICEMLYRILFENVLLDDAIKQLLARPYKLEGI